MNTANLLKRKQNDASTSISSKKGRASEHRGGSNPFLKRPCNPEESLLNFLIQCRTKGRNILQSDGSARPPLLEVEARIGCLKSPLGLRDMRVMSSGAKMISIEGSDPRKKAQCPD